MRFEWDEAKRRANIRAHGIDFADCENVFLGTTLTIEDTRVDYGETRYLTLGLLKEHVVVIVHTEVDDVIRYISARKATKYETKEFFSQIAN